MQVRWLGTPLRRGSVGDPVPTCPPGQVWSSTALACVAVDPSPLITPVNLTLAPQVCPQGWSWHAKYGECVPPQDSAWPTANCPAGYKYDNQKLYCVPLPSSGGTTESKTTPALIVGGLALLALLAAS